MPSFLRTALKALQKGALKFGVDVRRFNPVVSAPHRRAVILRSLGVTHTIDVGANVGQYGSELRNLGFDGEIISFEPMPREFALLTEASNRDDNWTPMQLAVSNFDGDTTFHVTTNSVASSLLSPVKSKISDDIDTRVAQKIDVTVRRLDGLILPKLPKQAKVFLKVDAQGSEMDVLEGAVSPLERCVAVELEVSVLPLYEGQVSGLALLDYMQQRGWTAVSFNAECVHPKTMMVLQNDVLFVRSELVI